MKILLKIKSERKLDGAKNKIEELLPALEQLIAHNGPALLEIITDATLI